MRSSEENIVQVVGGDRSFLWLRVRCAGSDALLPARTRFVFGELLQSSAITAPRDQNIGKQADIVVKTRSDSFQFAMIALLASSSIRSNRRVLSGFERVL